MSKEIVVAREERTSPEATLTSKGQVTVPAAVRADMGIRSGDRLRFDRVAKDRFVVTPVRRTELSKVAGMFARVGRQVRREDMNSLRKRAADARAKKLDAQP